MTKSTIALLVGFAFAAPVFAQDAATSGAGTIDSTTTIQSATTTDPSTSPSDSTGQPARSAAECDALLKKADTSKNGRITESSVATEPSIAVGFSDPTVKSRGYMTSNEFTALCSGVKMPSGG